MTALQMSITDRALEKLPLATEGQYIVRDVDLKGFLVVIGKRRKTYTVKGEGWQNGKRKNVYAAIGLVGDLTARDARLKAKECLTRIARGLPAIEADEDCEPAPDQAPQPVGVTLWEAWERYRDAHMVRKNRSARTIASYADQAEYHGYPVRSSEPIGESVYLRFAAWAEENGTAADKPSSSGGLNESGA